MNRVSFWFVLVAPWLAAIGMWLYLAFAGGPVLDRSETAAQVRDGVIVAERVYRKRRNCETHSASYSLQRNDGQTTVIVPLNIRPAVLNTGEGDLTRVLIRTPVPSDIPSGEYRLRVSVAWRCTPFQTQIIHALSPPFDIP